MEPSDLEYRRHQGSQRHPKIPVQEEEWLHEPEDKDTRHKTNIATKPISYPFPRESPTREFIPSVSAPRETSPREIASRELAEPVTQRRSQIQRRYHVQFKFDKKLGYNMVKGMYSRIIWNLQLSSGSQDLQYIHAFIMYPQFWFMDNLMYQITGKLFQMINLSKGDPATPTLTEAMTGHYKTEFMQAMNQEINEL